MQAAGSASSPGQTRPALDLALSRGTGWCLVSVAPRPNVYASKINRTRSSIRCVLMLSWVPGAGGGRQLFCPDFLFFFSSLLSPVFHLYSPAPVSTTLILPLNTEPSPPCLLKHPGSWLLFTHSRILSRVLFISPLTGGQTVSFPILFHACLVPQSTVPCNAPEHVCHQDLRILNQIDPRCPSLLTVGT